MKRLLITVHFLAGACFLLIGCGDNGRQTTALRPAAFHPASPAQTTQPATAQEARPLPVAPIPGNTSTSDPTASSAPAASGNSVSLNRPAKASSLGSFMWVGTVIAEANGQPIYADKVLAKIDAELSQKTHLDPATFKDVAQKSIKKQVDSDVYDELEYAAAQRLGGEEDQQIAAALTTQWRQREINKAGGSLAVARRRSLEEDHIDFDEKVKEQYRRNLILLYYQQKVWPRVKVSADDLRRYYDQHLATEFSEASAVRFRLIKSLYRDVSDRGRALTKAQGIHDRAKRGEDFAILATELNDDRSLAKNKGFMSLMDEKDAEGQVRKVGAWFAKDTLRREEVEKAIFALEPGQITEIIDGNDAFYIAKLEEKKVGRVKAFEELQVQESIRNKLERDQRDDLRLKEREKLWKARIVLFDEKNFNVAVDMAMQKYGIWTRDQKPETIN